MGAIYPFLNNNYFEITEIMSSPVIKSCFNHWAIGPENAHLKPDFEGFSYHDDLDLEYSHIFIGSISCLKVSGSKSFQNSKISLFSFFFFQSKSQFQKLTLP